MFCEKSLAAYKGRPALVRASDDKILIELSGGQTLKVREKDIELIHGGPVNMGLEELDAQASALSGDLRGTWELLEAESHETESGVTLKELAELIYGEYSPQSAWAAYGVLKDGLYFTGTLTALLARRPEDIARDKEKRAEKEKEGVERETFLKRAKERKLEPGDGRFLQDLAALSYGRSEKSRTLRDLGKSETAQEAHRMLLSLGVWSPYVNPHPPRFGIELSSAVLRAGPPPEEARRDLRHLAAYAIDNEWSNDPDDALSVEVLPETGEAVLYVHVADPASAILSGSPADNEAQGRGATLYLPEGSRRMLAEEDLPLYALGLAEVSPALSFKLNFDQDGAITGTDIFPSLVRVTRLSYGQSDALLEAADQAVTHNTAPADVSGRGVAHNDAVIPDQGAALRAIEALALRGFRRRVNAGAAIIELPEVHISVTLPKEESAGGQVSVSPVASSRSADMVRECMLLAGEASARWAIHKRLPFPFVSQETGDLPRNPLPGMAGSYQLRRCMRPRLLSAKPGLHGGLGLECYTQVTSPLRRYTDLLAHQQIRSFLAGRETLSEDEILMRLATGEAAAQAVNHAERASRAHWTAVYMADKKGSAWDAVLLEKKGERWAVVLPLLGWETQVSLRGDFKPNDTVRVVLKSVDIPLGELHFAEA
ncbi:MAG: RNB domain-containing ribonuclease [Spirochaetaceae bacterium]|jgi:exoribonuclease-2|nr:RNB domain-containing ribonuclease [Spirochaetaceae bacterium]